ncbi:hypothetical protein [Methylobacterium aerolatum]|uniref:Uncharacterized protein n=1 Tax=Methylobacterium aerolatum TaxID=418708 RepID=A0ABU0I0M2_9HYPH|nr:hypothetical protein [Methylobacterium aerolatum]MDQ0448147.1 hypothetical protein [Methylobacterium aerolatum]
MHTGFIEAGNWNHAHKTGCKWKSAAEKYAHLASLDDKFLLVDEYQNLDLKAIRTLLRFNDN